MARMLFNIKERLDTVVPVPDTKLDTGATPKKLLKNDQGKGVQKQEAWETLLEAGKVIDRCSCQYLQFRIPEPIHPILVSCLAGALFLSECSSCFSLR